MKQKLEIKKEVHDLNREWHKIPSIMMKRLLYLKEEGIKIQRGRYHTTYSSEKGEISLMEYNLGIFRSLPFWEICGISNNLPNIPERFTDKKEAIKVIKELLE
jgi:hypothetical protein